MIRLSIKGHILASVMILSGCAGQLQESMQEKSVENEAAWLITPLSSDLVNEGIAVDEIQQDIVIIGSDADDTNQILRLSAHGELRWAYRAKSEKNHYYSVTTTKQNRIIVAGDRASDDNTVQQAFLMNMFPNGTIDWQVQYDTLGDMAFYSVAEAEQGNLLLGGKVYPQGSGKFFDQAGDSFVLKTDMNGEILWTRRFRLLYDDEVEDIVSLPDGGVVILMNNRDANEQNLGVYLARLDKMGRLIDNQRLPISLIHEARKLIWDEARQRLLILGMQQGQKDPEFPDEEGLNALVVLSTDRIGAIDLFWRDHGHGDRDSILDDAVLTPDGSLIISSTISEQNTLESTLIDIVKINDQGLRTSSRQLGGLGINQAKGLVRTHANQILLLSNFDDSSQSQAVLFTGKLSTLLP